ncbi:MAG: elongation factor Ts, partial [Buchnera aphidicola]|nr:elongation factor Ts [Buchnera aphidicola]
QIEISKKLNKSSEILKKIIDGKMKKFVNSISLTGQNFIFEPHHTVGDVFSQNNGTILSFARFEIGHHTII